ncbi:DUF6318 family protein [Citricoccus nitrophenolicus]|uniref:DUF6318 family protein n=1 Tax=Citricoccus nitrophenolicus TaxID=863575 RepID=UPI0031ED6706
MAVPVNRSVRLGAVAALSVAGLLLTGCSGDGGGDGGDGPTSAASTASASPSASETADTAGAGSGSPSTAPSASPSGSYEPATSEGPAKNVPMPEMPEAMKEPTEEGLEAALEYWWEAGYYLQLTGEAGPFEQVSADQCVICDSLADNFDEIYGSGGWSTGAEYKIEDLVVDLNDDGTGSMIVVVREGPTHQYRSNGQEYASKDADKSFRTHWTGYASYEDNSEQWVIEELIVQSDSEINE